MRTDIALSGLGPDVELYAFAMPRCGPHGDLAVHLSMRASGMVMNYNMRLELAQKAHQRLGEALRAFDVARELAEVRSDPERRVPSGDPATREQERRYRAKLAVRLGLADADISAVFDLSEAELELLRAEVTGA